MTLYLESSAALRWLFAEEDGEQIRRTLAAASKVITSRLTLVETRRVIRRAEHEGRLTAAHAVDLLSILAQAAATWAVCEFVHDVAQRAEERFPVEPVRTLDAIHLSSALFLRQALSELVFLSRDERVQSNARALGFETI